MNKEFCTYEQALELKELGFNEPCLGYYVTVEVPNPFLVTTKISDTQGGYFTFAPLYQQAFRWFREKYQIDNWIYPNLNGLYSVSNVRRGIGLGKISEYQTYEEAEFECLKKLIEIVKR